MRILSRKSLAKETEHISEKMFDATVRGIKFYSNYFGFDFPYEKYDQIFCPEFKFGAMENVGAVTYSEGYLGKGRILGEADYMSFINVTLHELCHQWFGNLVTMQWWDDLWLNESFATYVSYLCMHKDEKLSVEYPNLWVSVNSYKNWGYSTDELPSNHPIVKDAVHTDAAIDMINGITYGKGCSFLKQLYHLIGDEAFSNSTKLYFSRF